jgi:NAD(P)-dependent dehydrogenase (short-subunit alcohol dehydrogenase family)
MKSPFDLLGKTIVVTGAVGLLGQAFCKALFYAGADLVLADIDGQKMDGFSKELRALNSDQEVHCVQVDITSEASVASLVAQCKGKFKKIDGLVNNAYPRNQNYGQTFFEVTYESFNENVSVHLGGYFLVCRAFGKLFKDQGEGHIVNMSSIYGVNAPDFSIYAGETMTMPVEYSAIKAGVIRLSKYMAAFLGPSGVRVNCLSPGGIEAGQPDNFQMSYNAKCHSKGLLQPEDMAGSLVFLMSDASRYMQAQNLVVDDGFTL